MLIALALVAVGLAAFIFVCVIRAVSCARFARALRSSGAADSLDLGSTVIDARHRFGARTPRSLTPGSRAEGGTPGEGPGDPSAGRRSPAAS
jgi:hypothetical protein